MVGTGVAVGTGVGVGTGVEQANKNNTKAAAISFIQASTSQYKAPERLSRGSDNPNYQ